MAADLGTIAGVPSAVDAKGLSARLGRMVAADDPLLSEAWADLGERAFVDTVAVLLAGRQTAAVTTVAETVLADQPPGGPSRSLAAGGRPMSARSAALIDGTAAHALDYDDVDDALYGHPSAVLVPTLLALGDACRSSGEELLGAYQRGLLACRWLAAALGIRRHYQAGWHATSTVGTLGAAAAAARLLGLPATAAQHALGMAASMAGGSRQNFGTMTKPLHVGLAAEHGILAATLARRGFTADPDQLDGPMGFLALFGQGARAVALVDHDPVGLNVKLYPCCYATHAAVDAALDLRKAFPADGTGPDGVTAIDVAVPPGGLAPLIHHRPSDGLRAKFSLEYAVTAALLDGEVILASFDDARLLRSAVQTLLQRVTVGETPNPPSGPPAWGDTFAAVVTLRLADGRTLTTRVDQPAGHATRPVSEARLRAKFTDCLTSAGIGATGQRYDVLRNLRRQPSAREVVDILTEESGRADAERR
jgi:2-methylcitrate dehydratase PrpD